jgi:hypothetical protein
LVPRFEAELALEEEKEASPAKTALSRGDTYKDVSTDLFTINHAISKALSHA